MKVLMLGWKLPPAEAGGLGTACAGLLDGLRARGVDVTHVAPGVFGASGARGPVLESHTIEVPTQLEAYPSVDELAHGLEAFQHRVQRAGDRTRAGEEELEERLRRLYRRFPPRDRPRHAGRSAFEAAHPAEQARRYADDVVRSVSDLAFDLVHAHDWMNFPAALRLRERTSFPLVCHVHSTELDRSGEAADADVEAIEHEGLRVADRVVCVSRATAERVRERYGVDARRLSVVHNGVHATSSRSRREARHPTVLFLGRVTRQKDPLAFLDIAARIARALPDARFVLAGDGDLLPRVREHAARLGLGDRLELPGFLAGAERDAALARAELLVVPSVSEPFGLVALEAAAAGTVALVPRGSGVTEVLTSVVPVEPRDFDATADVAVRLLADDERRRRLAETGRREAREVPWTRSAEALLAIYGELVG